MSPEDAAALLERFAEIDAAAQRAAYAREPDHESTKPTWRPPPRKRQKP